MTAVYCRDGRCETLPLALLESDSWRLGWRAFTTLRVRDERVELWRDHRERLRHSLAIMGAESNAAETLLNELEQQLTSIRKTSDSIVRIDLIRFDQQKWDWLLVQRPLPAVDPRAVVRLLSRTRDLTPGDGRVKWASYIEQLLLADRQETSGEPLYECQEWGLQEGIFSNVFLLDSEGPIFPRLHSSVLQGLYVTAFKRLLDRKKIILREDKIFYNQIAPDQLLVLCNCARGFRYILPDHEALGDEQQKLWDQLLTWEREFIYA